MSEPGARDLSDRLGKMLAQADRLLAEWQAYSEELRRQLDGQAARVAEDAVNNVRTELIAATRRAVDELAGSPSAEAERLKNKLEAASRAAGGLGGGRGSFTATAVSIATLIAVLGLAAAVWMRWPPDTGSGVGVSSPETAVDAAPEEAPVVIDAALRPPPKKPVPPCSDLMRGAPPADVTALFRGCARVACGFQPPKRDTKNRALIKALETCEAPDAQSGLYSAMAALLEKRRRLAACSLPRNNPRGGLDVELAWVAECSGTSGP